MRVLQATIGIVFVAIGIAAIVDGDLGSALWWMIATGVAVAGVFGLASASRSGD